MTESTIISLVARLGPWLAPIPSAYFVARAAVAHLAVPDPIAAVIALTIELLGLTTVATALQLYDWNAACYTAAGNLRRGRRPAPTIVLALSIALVALYLAVTIGLTVLLETLPHLATYAPAIFPLLAIVGATNLAVRANQAARELDALAHRPVSKKVSKPASNERPNERPTDRTGAVSAPSAPVQMDTQMNNLDVLNVQKTLNRDDKLDALVQLLEHDRDWSITELAEHLNVKSRTTVYNYLEELEDAGRIRRNGSGIEVL